jgi:recombination protein RecR
MNPIERLTSLFEKLPGIGPRQARRFVQYLLAQPESARKELAQAVLKLGSETKECPLCHRWFVKKRSKEALCSICSSTTRDKGLLCVVEKEADLEQLERSGFSGLYFVLGGTIPLGSEEPEKHIRAKELLNRISEEGAAKKLHEVILGLSATSEGDHTRQILFEKIEPMAGAWQFKLSSLGRGLSTGSELEYADPDTIASALSSRH